MNSLLLFKPVYPLPQKITCLYIFLFVRAVYFIYESLYRLVHACIALKTENNLPQLGVMW